MATDSASENIPLSGSDASPARAAEAGRSLDQVKEECEQLRQRVRQLEGELQRERETLALVREECAQYRSLIYPAIWQQYTEEELRSFAEDDSEEGALQLDQFIGELEDIVDGKPSA
jgi:Ribonuclease G/E